ncbi:hypothetical protein FB45DRAFT_942941 [Roridomyces roridus]|uniref:F-box domain-containing protein n=1 Tax=Roridomyces roridus TaxID=1738132 RepID=A0AAD7B4B7_9AGAR|nr:hypothetical protein FB45DRAFT_942941 [Roridomyces roridus]
MSTSTSSANDQLRAHLAEIRAKIVTLECELATLHNLERITRAALDSITYPVLSLPVEITLAVFLHYVGPPIQQYPSQCRESPLPLTAVCKLWRNIALSYSELWPALDGHPPVDSAVLLNLLQARLSRVGSTNFRINMPLPISSSEDKILPILAPYFPQLQSLQLTLAGPISFPTEAGNVIPLPALEALQINGEDWPQDKTGQISLPYAPRLRDVWLWDTARVSLPWSQLTFLGLQGLSLTDCLGVLQQTSQLGTLKIDAESDDAAHGTPIELRYLRAICSATCPVINHLILPVVEDLEIQLFTDEVNATVHNLTARSGCTLNRLRLRSPMGLMVVEQCIRPLQRLRALSLTSCRGYFHEWVSFLQQISKGELLPELEVFLLDGMEGEIPISALLTMLKARANPPEGIAQFKAFRCSHWQEPWNEMDSQHTAERIRELRAEGMSVEIGWGPGWFRGTSNIISSSPSKRQNLIIADTSYFG